MCERERGGESVCMCEGKRRQGRERVSVCVCVSVCVELKHHIQSHSWFSIPADPRIPHHIWL